MAWNTNKSPLEYLEQRVRYYKKSEKQFLRYLRTGEMSSRFTDEQINQGLINIRIRIKQFEDACLILAQNLKL